MKQSKQDFTRYDITSLCFSANFITIRQFERQTANFVRSCDIFVYVCVAVYVYLCFLLLPRYGAFDLGLAVSVPLPIVTGIFVLLWFQSRLT